MGLLVELLNGSKLHIFLDASVKYIQILSVHFTLLSNNTSEINYDIRRSSDCKTLICASKLDRFDISKYCNGIGFSKTKSLFIHAFLKKFQERTQDQKIQDWFKVT